MQGDFFQTNRQRLVETLQHGLIVLTAYHDMQRDNDAAFAFEQEANFWYLTGIEEADWQVILDGKSGKTWLVQPDIDDISRVFNGGLSARQASQISGIDTVISTTKAKTLLRDLASRHDTVYTIGSYPSAKDAKHYGFVANPAQHDMWQRLKKVFGDVEDCRLVLAKLRAIKQPVEIDAMKRAINLTIDAFNDVKKRLPDMQYEYEIEAAFSHYFRSRGAKGHAYDPIIASAQNACTLHYSTNNDHLQNDTLLLIDVGARLGGYAADMTRTYAIGMPTKRQVAVHSAVTSAQQHIIALLKPGLLVQEYHEKVDAIMQSALRDLGLSSSTPDGSRRYFPHGVSHGLGIDVHDALGRPDTFLPGMVITVEPGIYIPEESIGVRIEDDILITATGQENLSAALPTSL